jgi:hypothetical protein
MSEPENFLSRWSRRKREAEAAPDAEADATPAVAAAPEAAPAPALPAAEEPAFDLSSLPSIEEIAADTDVSMFMKSGVPSALRHAALRRAWASDPAIRDFRGLQENDWDFNAPESIPGFGSFKSEAEIEDLAHRLFGPDRTEPEQVPQSLPQDNRVAKIEDAVARPESLPGVGETIEPASAPTVPANHPDAAEQKSDAAVQLPRRHGGALPQ